MTVWICTVAAIAAIVSIHFASTIRHHAGKRHRFIEIGKEEEEMWIPGDRAPWHDNQDDEDDR
ncbi:hypothetical protein [uncultured Muribaculum sp.]|uniref:hypothetical protein n=1 Tax=uncultured Muribaculum sp. TaxID=1918613 RepID=UPI0025EBF8BD|nr:hypothetical protein [uncultured Muribaculum sp.]